LRAAGVSLWLDTSGLDAAALWGEQIVNAFSRGDSADNLKAIVRALQRLGVKVAPLSQEVKPAAPPVQADTRVSGEAAAGAERGALAVLPFDNISPDRRPTTSAPGSPRN
jgi:hypothetical protein